MEFIVVHNRRNNSLSVNIRIVEIKRRLFHHLQNIYSPFTSISNERNSRKILSNICHRGLYVPSLALFFSPFPIRSLPNRISIFASFSPFFHSDFLSRNIPLSILFFFFFDLVDLVENKSLTKIQVKIDIANRHDFFITFNI